MAELLSPPVISSSAAHLSSDALPQNRQASMPVGFYRELVALALFVALADLTIYRGGGFTGLAAFFIAALILLFVNSTRRA